MPTSEGLGGDANVAVGARLPRATSVGAVAGFRWWGAAADALAVPCVAWAAFAGRSVSFIAARVVRTAGAVAHFDAADVDDSAVARIASTSAPLVDGGRFALSGSTGLSSSVGSGGSGG